MVFVTNSDVISPLNLKELRLSMGLNKSQFAEMVDLNRRTYSAYENGERGLTYEGFRAMKEKLGFLYSGAGRNLRGMIDYFRVTFKEVHDLRNFCLSYLGCPLNEFTESQTGLLSYNRVWRRGNIWLFDYADKVERGNYQVTMQLSGQGCREMELLFRQFNMTWFEFISNLASRSDMQVTRLDVALDEMYQGYGHEADHIELSDIITKTYHDEVKTRRMRSWNHIGGGAIGAQKDESDRQGISLYYGSRQSDQYFNFYEKRFELAKREGIDVQEALEVFGIWNRYELRFSHSKAQGVIDELLAGVDIAEVARGVLNHEIMVYDGTNKFGAYKPDKKWQLLFGGVEPLKLTVKPEHYNIKRTVNWLVSQVSNSYALIDEVDRLLNTEYLELFRKSGRISERGEQMLKDLKSNYRLEVK